MTIVAVDVSITARTSYLNNIARTGFQVSVPTGVVLYPSGYFPIEVEFGTAGIADLAPPESKKINLVHRVVIDYGVKTGPPKVLRRIPGAPRSSVLIVVTIPVVNKVALAVLIL